jgi:hypothetical protein
MKLLSFTGIAGSAALLFASPSAIAQTVGDNYWLEVSVFLPKVDSEIQVSSTTSSAPGTKIDLESVLGLDKHEALPAISGGLRLSRNIVVVLDYYAVGRNSTKTLARDIVIEDVTYPVGGEVRSGFDSDIYRLTVGYSFIHNEKVEIGAAIGVHATNFEASVSGNGQIAGTPVQSEVRRQEFLAPIPTLGLYGSTELAPGLTLSARVDYLSLKIDDYDGSLLNTQAAIAYRVFGNVAIGAMYRFVDYKVDVEKERYTGRFEYKFMGPSLFLRARW